MTDEKKADEFLIRMNGFINAVREEYNVTIWAETGRKYVKMVQARSVYCFIDMKTGDILKAATFSKPAKHARSNINDADFGLSGVTEYGPKYLR